MRKLKFLILALLLGSSVASAQIDVQQVLSIGRNAIYFNDYIVSMGYFNQVIGLRPWMAEPYFYRSVAKINLDDYRGAEEDATLALERNPFLSRAYLVRGIARFSQKAYEPSISDFQHGLSLAPSDVGLRYNLAIAFLKLSGMMRQIVRLGRFFVFHHAIKMLIASSHKLRWSGRIPYKHSNRLQSCFDETVHIPLPTCSKHR